MKMRNWEKKKKNTDLVIAGGRVDAMKTLEDLCLRVDDDDDDDRKLHVVGFSFKAIAVNV